MAGEVTEEFIVTLAGLGARLEHVLVSATVDACGQLGLIGELAEKVETALAADALQSIHAVGLANDQRDKCGNTLFETSAYAGRIAGEPGYDPRCRQPIVLAANLAGLVYTLDRTLEEETRFGKRLPLPPELTLDDPRYSEARYFGRGWLRREVADFIQSNACGYVVIEADAIWGKTSFALDWYRHSLRRDAYELPHLAGWVFIRKEAGGYWVDPDIILLALEAETRYQRNLPRSAKGSPDRERLHYSEAERADGKLAGHMGDFFNELGKEAQRSGIPAVLLIDGVDEIWGPSGEQPSARLPDALPKVLQQGVFIVLLSRPGYHLRWEGGGPPTSPYLSIDLAAALGAETSTNAESIRWRLDIGQDLERYIESRASDIERTDATQSALDAARLLRTALRTPLLAAAQGYIFVLAALLEADDDLPERLQSWQANPNSIPKGPKKLIAGVITRILGALDKARNQGKLGTLDDTDYVAQALACLGLAACLRQPLGVQTLVELLFDTGNGAMPTGTIPLGQRIGRLNPGLFNEGVLKIALRFGAECFVGRSRGQLPKSTAFWHPLMRDALRAAWVCVAQEETNPDADTIVAKLDAPAMESLAPLHLLIAAAWSRHCVGADGQDLAGPRREARDYALSWGPWHAAISGDTQAVAEAGRSLADSTYLQHTYDAIGIRAHHCLDLAMEETINRSSPDSTRLVDIRRTLAQHDTVLATGTTRIAAILFNDLAGLEPPGSSWRAELGNAAQPALVRRQPGTPVPIVRSLQRDGQSNTAISPCGNWLAVPDGSVIRLYRVEGGGYRNHQVARIEGRKCPVVHVAFSALQSDEHSWLAGVYSDGSLGLFSVGAGGPVEGRLQRIEGYCTLDYATFSSPMPDGRMWLASASEDKTVLLALGANGLWNEAAQRIDGQKSKINHVSFSPPLGDGRMWLASASDDGKVGLVALGVNGFWEEMPRCIEMHRAKVNHVAFSPTLPDGRMWLASASDCKKLGLLALGSNGLWDDMPRCIEGHDAKVNHVAFSTRMPDGRIWLASASDDTTVGLLVLGANPPADQRLQGIEGHEEPVKHVTFSAPRPDGGMWLASASDDNMVGLLALTACGHCDGPLQRMAGHRSKVFHVAFSVLLPDNGLWLASASRDGTVGLLALESEPSGVARPRRIEGHENSILHVASSAPLPHGRMWLASGSRDHKVGLLALGDRLHGASLLQRIEGHDAKVNHVAFSTRMPDGRIWLASASDDTTVGLLVLGANPPADQRLQGIEGHEEPVKHVTFSAPRPDGGMWLASASYDGNVGLLALGKKPLRNARLQLLRGHEKWVHHVAFSAPLHGGRMWLASASGDKTGGAVGLIALGKEAPGKGHLQLVQGHSQSVDHVAFSPPLPDGRVWLASAARDTKVGLLALGGEQLGDARLQIIDGHSKFVHQVAFSAPLPDGRLWLASASGEKEVGLLALGRSGPETAHLRCIEGHETFVRHVAFSAPLADGRLWLASAGRQEIILWSIPEGTLVARISFAGTGEIIHQIRWSDDCRLLYVAGEKNRIPVDLTLMVPDF